MSDVYTCGHLVIRDGHEDACDEPATGGVRHYDFEGEQYTEPTCHRHAQRFPLSDALGKYGQWFPSAGSFILSAVSA